MKTKVDKKIIVFLIPFILGLVTSFSLPPYNFIFINFITFPLLFSVFINNHKINKFAAFNIGWFFGFGYFISNLYWITNSLTFDETFKNLIPFALILIPLFLGAFYGLITLVSSFFNLKKNISSILIFVTIFSLIEYLRAIVFGGFPWNLIVYSWASYLPFLQILSLIGTYSMNLLSLTLFLVPTILFIKKKRNTNIIFLLFSTFLILVNYFYGLSTISNFEKIRGQNLETTIKIISPKIEINKFYEANSTDLILNDLIKLSDPNKAEKTIFIFPEGVLIGSYLDDLKNYQDLFKSNFSNKHKLIIGINSTENYKIYNSMVVLDNQLKILTKYNKNKLVPFGEFLPFENFFKKIGLKKITQGYQSFSADDKREILEINQLKFIPLICYEIIYSGKINPNKKYYDFILNISEDGWFGKSIGPAQHLSHSIFRSIEEGKNVIRSTNNGVSAFVNPKGQIIKQIREKGYFVASDLKSQTNLSDKSIERYIKVLLDKGFFYIKKGKDRRIKRYYPSKDLDKHIRATWEVRIKQIETILETPHSKYKEILKFLKEDKYVW